MSKNKLSREVYNIQNPALGAFLLWSFVKGYQKGNRELSPPNVILLFLVLPLIMHRQSFELIKGTQKASGLKGFIAKFSKSDISKRDVLMALHPRVDQWKDLTLSSIRIALMKNIFHLDDDGSIYYIDKRMPKPGLIYGVRHLVSESEKLGFWFSQESFSEISLLLNIRF